MVFEKIWKKCERQLATTQNLNLVVLVMTVIMNHWSARRVKVCMEMDNKHSSRFLHNTFLYVKNYK
jgi:hypothetical protein